jgi:hypothetical protein
MECVTEEIEVRQAIVDERASDEERPAQHRGGERLQRNGELYLS